MYYEASLISISTNNLKYQIANALFKRRDTIFGVKKHSTTATHNRIQPYDSLYLVFLIWQKNWIIGSHVVYIIYVLDRRFVFIVYTIHWNVMEMFITSLSTRLRKQIARYLYHQQHLIWNSPTTSWVHLIRRNKKYK